MSTLRESIEAVRVDAYGDEDVLAVCAAAELWENAGKELDRLIAAITAALGQLQ